MVRLTRIGVSVGSAVRGMDVARERACAGDWLPGAPTRPALPGGPCNLRCCHGTSRYRWLTLARIRIHPHPSPSNRPSFAPAPPNTDPPSHHHTHKPHTEHARILCTRARARTRSARKSSLRTPMRAATHTSTGRGRRAIPEAPREKLSVGACDAAGPCECAPRGRDASRSRTCGPVSPRAPGSPFLQPAERHSKDAPAGRVRHHHGRDRRERPPAAQPTAAAALCAFSA
jgi:hypothetical protein